MIVKWVISKKDLKTCKLFIGFYKFYITHEFLHIYDFIKKYTNIKNQNLTLNADDIWYKGYVPISINHQLGVDTDTHVPSNILKTVITYLNNTAEIQAYAITLASMIESATTNRIDKSDIISIIKKQPSFALKFLGLKNNSMIHHYFQLKDYYNIKIKNNGKTLNVNGNQIYRKFIDYFIEQLNDLI